MEEDGELRWEATSREGDSWAETQGQAHICQGQKVEVDAIIPGVKNSMHEGQEAEPVMNHKQRWQKMKLEKEAKAGFKNISHIQYQRMWTSSWNKHKELCSVPEQVLHTFLNKFWFFS